jgi:DNA-binding Xre family transcriptional regulator
MVSKNLKVGDTFVEGEQTYIIDEIVPLGYNAHAITTDVVKKAEKPVENTDETEVSEITSNDVNYSKTQVNRMPNAQLEKLCKELGLEVGTGTEMKRAIIAKLGL